MCLSEFSSRHIKRHFKRHIKRKMRRIYFGWSDGDVAGVYGSPRSCCVHGMTSSCLECLEVWSKHLRCALLHIQNTEDVNRDDICLRERNWGQDLLRVSEERSSSQICYSKGLYSKEEHNDWWWRVQPNCTACFQLLNPVNLSNLQCWVCEDKCPVGSGWALEKASEKPIHFLCFSIFIYLLLFFNQQ